jgi:hypothetical protein
MTLSISLISKRNKFMIRLRKMMLKKNLRKVRIYFRATCLNENDLDFDID